ncbi:MAG: hypothetical protein FWD57_14690 [Polyangiaceae bacterium]|nr:hypothetical protein [Polyangiaceae bacterium]
MHEPSSGKVAQIWVGSLLTKPSECNPSRAAFLSSWLRERGGAGRLVAVSGGSKVEAKPWQPRA